MKKVFIKSQIPETCNKILGSKNLNDTIHFRDKDSYVQHMCLCFLFDRNCLSYLLYNVTYETLHVR